ncbi:ribonuclease H-like domain-containing protein [Tanacetum coccineum]
MSIPTVPIKTPAKVTASHTVPIARPDTVTTRLTKVTGSSSDPITTSTGPHSTTPVHSVIPNVISTGPISVIFWKLEANVPNDADYDVWIPLALVHEEGYGFKRVTMVKGFFFFKFSSIEGVDSMLRDGPWMIHEIPIFLNKWSPLVSLLKEELLHVPVWGANSYARILIEINACNDFSDNLVMAILNLEGIAAPKQVLNSMDKGNRKTSGADDDGFIEVKRKKSNVNNGGSKNFKPVSGKLVFVDDDGKPLEKVDYVDILGSDDEVEPVDNEMENVVDDDYNPYDDNIYEGHEIVDNIQTICDNLDIKMEVYAWSFFKNYWSPIYDVVAILTSIEVSTEWTLAIHLINANQRHLLFKPSNLETIMHGRLLF